MGSGTELDIISDVRAEEVLLILRRDWCFTCCEFGYLLLGSWRINSFVGLEVGEVLLISGRDSCAACCLCSGHYCVAMSGGTPVGGGYMRQRHSQGYASSGDDLEDDACSRPSPSSPRSRTWIEILENMLWLASAAFIVYYGDRHHNLIYLLWHDDRIRR